MRLSRLLPEPACRCHPPARRAAGAAERQLGSPPGAAGRRREDLDGCAGRHGTSASRLRTAACAMPPSAKPGLDATSATKVL